MAYKAFDWHYYAIWVAVSLISFGAALLLPVSEGLQSLISIPGVVSLVAAAGQAVFQVWRDRAAYERQIALQARERDFTLSIASQMAQEAFQKHVAFCEEYLKTAHEVLQELFDEGPRPEMHERANALVRIRAKYEMWLTDEIEAGLMPFEQNIRQVATSQQILAIPGMQVPERLVFADRMAAAITELIDSKRGEQRRGKIVDIIDALRSVLGAAQLTELRLSALNDAIRRIRESSR